MNRKMLSRDRYPKDASLYSSSGSVTQVPQPVASTSLNYTQPPEVPLYNAQTTQFQSHQNFQNSWQTNSSPLYAPLQNQQQPQIQNSWPCEQQYAQPTTAENNVWNWTPENNMYSHNVQGVTQHQFQQPEAPKTVPQYACNTISHSYYASENVPSNQPVNTSYSTHNDWYSSGTADSKKHNGNQPAEQVPQPTWEAVTANISQAEHLPWTYSVPQNTVTAAENFGQWSSNAVPQDSVSYSSVAQNWNETSNNGWQDLRNFESHPTSLDQGADVENNAFVPYQGVTNVHENNLFPENSSNGIENIESHVATSLNSDVQVSNNVNEVNDNENSGLSAFFHHSVEENIETTEESSVCEASHESLIAHANEENIPLAADPEVVNPVHNGNTSMENSTVNEDVQGDGGSFQQNQAVPSTEAEVVAAPSAEEPLNQEVPEPYSACSVASPQQIIREDSPDEPLNQQVPAETAVATPAVVERNGIVHEESSPFKQPVKSSTIAAVVQQESKTKSSFLAKSNHQGSFQEVNLETVPDNLERPPDYDDLKKESSLSASFRQHLRSMEKENVLNLSKASLWEDPKLPCVLLAPAAPLQPKVPLLVTADSAHTTVQATESKNAADVTSVSSAFQDLHINDVKAAVPSTISSSIEEKSLSPVPNPVPIVDSSRGSKEMAPVSENMKTNLSNLKVNQGCCESPMSMRASPVKEQRQFSSYTDMPQAEQYPPYSNIERDRHSRSYTDVRGKPPPPDFEYDQNNSRYNYRSLERNPDRRMMDNRYSSFDERQPFNREGSRPSSRMSLDESTESHANRERSYRRNYGSDYDRPPSRMSESEAYRAHREGYPPYLEPHYNRSSYNRDEEYYQMRGYRGYDYDPYHAARPYYGYYDPYRYSYSSYNYGFYDELYRTDPRYRKQLDDQYREYYKRMGYETDYERSSAYSGRSSANELNKDVSQRYPENDSSSDMRYPNYEQESQVSSYEASEGKQSTPISRLTPIKFSSPHAFANCTPSGQLLTFVPTKSNSGYPALVEIHDMQIICQKSESYKELKQFQGPLVRRETHKNDIIDFCMQKVKFYKQQEGIHDRESYILLWELLILLLRQNGSVAGSDIAELLLKDHEVLRPPLLHHTSDIPQGDSSPAEITPVPVPGGDASSPDEGIVVTRDKTILNSAQCFDMDKVTRKFREFLLFGHKKDALEWAMKHNLWGHALFLASKMDVRTYANVMTRFANSLALNDPLQTLYQLMSGRQPAAVTCIADKQWGDWRPHLAMILSNPSAHSEVDFKSITTLGDTLAAQGCLPATHFCYLMAQVEFGSYSCKSSKMILLLADHQLPFEKFATNEAIQCTEIYEYAQSLANPGFLLNHLQAYKFIYATRLVDHGFPQEALHYCEVLAKNFLTNPSAFPADLIQQVYELSLKLKYYDPHYMQGQGELEEQEDPEWLRTLASLLGHIQENQSQSDEGCFESQPEISSNAKMCHQNSVEGIPEVQNAEIKNESFSVQQNHNAYSNAWITGNILQQQQPYSELGSYDHQLSPQEAISQNQPNYFPQWNLSSPKQDIYYENQVTKPVDEIQSSIPPTSESHKFNFYGPDTKMSTHSVHSKERTSSTSSIGLAKDRRDSALSSGSDFGTGRRTSSKSGADIPKSEDKAEKSRPQVGRSWLGGIFSKLLPKAPNQMILPDDKNPTIVWDPVQNHWINTDSKDEDVNLQPSAPPKDTELISKSPETPIASSMPPVAASSTPVTNKFQRQKVKGMRQNYVDIMNPTVSPTETPPSSDILFSSMPVSHTATKMLVPTAPASDDHPMDFVSTQSYSYGATQGDEETVPQAPPMFDPAEFDSRRANINPVRHSIGSAHRTYPT